MKKKQIDFLIMVILLLAFVITDDYMEYIRLSYILALVIGSIYFMIRKLNVINLDNILDEYLKEYQENDGKNHFEHKLSILLIGTIVVLFIIYNCKTYIKEMNSK